MVAFDDYFDDDDSREIEYIKEHLPVSIREKLSDDIMSYIIELLADYYMDNDTFDDNDDDAIVDIDEISCYVVKMAREDDMGDIDAEEVARVVRLDLEYNSNVDFATL